MTDEFECFNKHRICRFIEGGIVTMDRSYPCDYCRIKVDGVTTNWPKRPKRISYFEFIKRRIIGQYSDWKIRRMFKKWNNDR